MYVESVLSFFEADSVCHKSTEENQTWQLKEGNKLRWMNLKCDYYKLLQSARRKVGMTHERSHQGLMDCTRESLQPE